jgi:hypothetical protein
LARNTKKPKQPREWKVENRAVLRTGEDRNRTFSCFSNVLEAVRELPETIHSGPCFVLIRLESTNAT